MIKVKIADKMVGEGEPCFIIAEAGINHNGNVRLAEKLIRAAKKSGVDAIKFQTFKTENFVNPGEDQFKLFKRLELGEKDWERLFDLATDLGIIFLSTPLDEESVDLLDELGVPAFKVASGDLTHLPLLEFIAKKKKPMIVSTGMGTLGEIKDALSVIFPFNKKVCLMHCISSYPADLDEMNLKSIETLKRTFDLPVGLSDHSMGCLAPLVAVGLGANLIEKHFTLGKNLNGPDQKFSLGPREFAEIVKNIRMVENSLGDGKKLPTKSEIKIRKLARRSIAAKNTIPKGSVIKKSDLKIVRPNIGIEPKFMKDVIGKTVKKTLRKDEFVKWDALSTS